MLRPLALLMALCGACVSAPEPWAADLLPALSSARKSGRHVVAFFALPGREQSDRMERECIGEPVVRDALRRGGFASVRLDGFQQQRLYGEWVGGGEGMGLCVLDRDGKPYAARPGPLDAPEVAALLDACIANRVRIEGLRAEVAAAPTDAALCHALGCMLLDLGCRVGAEPLLLQAAHGGALDAHHRLARLYALDGHVVRARQWLRTSLPSPAADVTLGYVLFKERRYREAAETLANPAQDPSLGDDALRARLYLAKSLIQSGDKEAARAVLVPLSRDARGSTFGAAADHSIAHLDSGDHDHTH